jgi:hypothetical protein
MAFQIRPDRADDSSAPISSAFREFSIYSLPEFLSSRLFTSPLGSLWGQRAPTQNSEEPEIVSLLGMLSTQLSVWFCISPPDATNQRLANT